MKVIDRRAKIPEYLKNENKELLHEFIAEYIDQISSKVDYRGLIDELRNFNYEEANQKGSSLGAYDKEAAATLRKEKESNKKTIFEDEYIVLDSQKVPPNVLDQIENRMVKVGRLLRRNFVTEKNLDDAIRGVSSVDKNGNVSVDDLKNFVLNSCKDHMIHNTHK